MSTLKNSHKLALSLLAATLLAACDGEFEVDVGVEFEDEAESNQPPTFADYVDDIEVDENVEGIIYTAYAHDADGNLISYSLAGGGDRDRFSIGARTGDLQFLSPPDYEYPVDNDDDNEYVVFIEADDGVDSSSMSLRVKVLDVVDEDGEDQPSSILPEDFSASAGDTQVSLDWTADAGASYSVYRSSDADCDLDNYNSACSNSKLYASASPGLVDSGLVNGNTYYYWLEAEANGASERSADAIAVSLVPRLNDTGITGGGDYPSGFDNHNGVGNTCDGGYLDADNGNAFVAFDDEDCELGRDASNNDDSDGNAGFDFTKLDISGNALSADASAWACVLDNVTGLIWEVKTTDGTWRDVGKAFTWYNPNHGQDYDKDGNAITFYGTESSQDTQDFVDYVNSDSSINNGSGLCGRTDWRLPTVHEIQGLADYDAVVTNDSGGYSTPSIDNDYFPYTLTSQYQWYWTSNLNVDPDVNPGGGSSTSNYFAWAYGSAEARTRSGTGSIVGTTDRYNFVRLVSSSTAVESHFSDYSDNRYTDNGDGTISDAQTGLMWSKCSYGQTYDGGDSDQDGIICEGSPAFGDWPQAFAWAADSNANTTYGHNDWRLPNIKELGSIVDFGSARPAINQSIFPSTASGPYWSSTHSRVLEGNTGNDDTQTSVIGFQAGDYGPSDRSSHLYLRLVRDAN